MDEVDKEKLIKSIATSVSEAQKNSSRGLSTLYKGGMDIIKGKGAGHFSKNYIKEKTLLQGLNASQKSPQR